MLLKFLPLSRVTEILFIKQFGYNLKQGQSVFLPPLMDRCAFVVVFIFWLVALR